MDGEITKETGDGLIVIAAASENMFALYFRRPVHGAAIWPLGVRTLLLQLKRNVADDKKQIIKPYDAHDAMERAYYRGRVQGYEHAIALLRELLPDVPHGK